MNSQYIVAANHSLTIFTQVLDQPTSMLHLQFFDELWEEQIKIGIDKMTWIMLQHCRSICSYFLGNLSRFQLMNSIAKYMAPKENTKWKKPYLYGISSSNCTSFLRNWKTTRTELLSVLPNEANIHQLCSDRDFIFLYFASDEISIPSEEICSILHVWIKVHSGDAED